MINGTKTWITNGVYGSCFGVLVKTDSAAQPRHKGMTMFLCEKGEGFRTAKKIRKLGYKSIDSAELVFEDFRVPAANLIGGEEGRGFQQAVGGLELGRINVAARGAGIAAAALRDALRYAQQRETFGKKLDERQAVQFMMAECASQLYIARLMLLHIAYKAEKGLDMRQENSIAKVYLAHMVHHVVDTAIQLHGALGYSRDTPLAAWYTHIRSQRLVDGPDEVHRWTVGRNVMKAFKATGTTAGAAGGDLL